MNKKVALVALLFLVVFLMPNSANAAKREIHKHVCAPALNGIIIIQQRKYPKKNANVTAAQSGVVVIRNNGDDKW